ncbi:MAG: glycoside hydrolase family 38 [Planctomycetes bacterium]|nr:glycoside hydrolase family 38 [Planctomycetota bacterium]
MRTGLVISGTHWDREWYETFQSYRFRLVDVIDGVLDILERDPSFRAFHLDGQTVILEDYLEIRPRDRARLERLAAAGRLLAGPWYVMPDEFLVSGEALIRNLLCGRAIAGEFGGAMPVGYVCDIFGHASQLPQILAGFGIRAAVVGRGAPDGLYPPQFVWRAPDGSEVLAYDIPDRKMYGEFFFDVWLPFTGRRADPDEAARRAADCLRAAAARSGLEVFPVLDALDHVPARAETPAVIRRANAILAAEEIAIEHATLPEYFARLDAHRAALPVVEGELRCPMRGGGHKFQIAETLSSRIPLKLRNAAAQAGLEAWTEPFASFASWLGSPYPKAFIDLAWKHLLQNHAHDSICGSSTDAVCEDMMYRFAQAERIAEKTIERALEGIAGPAAPAASDAPFAITLFNPGDRAIDGVRAVRIRFPKATTTRYEEGFGYESIIGFQVIGPDGAEVPFQRLAVEDRPAEYRLPPDGLPEPSHEEHVIAAMPVRIPAFGSARYEVRPRREIVRRRGSLADGDRTIENDALRVRADGDGTFELLDRATGEIYPGLGVLSDDADIGDGWFRGAPVADQVFSSCGAAREIAIIRDGPLQATLRVRLEMSLPAVFDFARMRRGSERAILPVDLLLTLRRGERHLDIRVEVDNAIRDHRLRILFPTGASAETALWDMPFDVVERQIALGDTSAWREQEVETRPQASFTAVADECRGLAAISAGLYETAVRDLPDRPIAVTLLRAVARGPFKRMEPAGQVPGRHVFRLALRPVAQPIDVRPLIRTGRDLLAGIRAIQGPAGGASPAARSFLDLETGEVVVSAVKGAEDGDGTIVRVWNPSDAEARDAIIFGVPVESAEFVTLAEERIEAVRIREGRVPVSLGPKRISALRIRVAPTA